MADRRPWSDAERETLAELTKRGIGSAKAARTINDLHHGGVMVRTVRAVQNQRTSQEWRVADPTVELRPPIVAPVSDPLEWLEKYRPVQVTPPSLPRASVQPTTGIEMVAGDMHFGTACEQSCSVFIETARLLKPQRIVLNGDLPDLLAVSKYPNDVRKKFSWDLHHEAAQMHQFLKELEAAVPRTAVIVETEANHSGNGTASRWWRYLSDRIAPLMALPGAEEKMSYQAWWYPAWSRLQLVESAVVPAARTGDLLILHGDIVRKHAGYSARATMEKWWHSTMNSHTHRMGGGFQSIPELPSRAAGQSRFYEIGCLCDLTPSYASAPNWTNGFAVIRSDGEDYNVELVPIIHGRAIVNALGQSVRAA